MGFTLERTAFVYHNGKLCVQDPGDSRTSQDWCFEVYGISRAEWTNLTRGYVRSGRIQFYTGADYEAVSDVSAEMVQELIDVHRKLYKHSAVGIFNGVIKGDLDLPWDPVLRYDPNDGGWYQM